MFSIFTPTDPDLCSETMNKKRSLQGQFRAEDEWLQRAFCVWMHLPYLHWTGTAAPSACIMSPGDVGEHSSRLLYSTTVWVNYTQGALSKYNHKVAAWSSYDQLNTLLYNKTGFVFWSLRGSPTITVLPQSVRGALMMYSPFADTLAVQWGCPAPTGPSLKCSGSTVNLGSNR